MPSSTWEDFEVDAGDRADVLAEEQPISRGTLRAASLSLIGASAVSGSVNSLTMFEPAAFGLMADDPEVRPFIDSIQAVLTTDPSPDEVLRRSVALVGDDLSRFSIPLPESLVGAARVQMHSVFCWQIYLSCELSCVPVNGLFRRRVVA